jgi:hypothetical protein
MKRFQRSNRYGKGLRRSRHHRGDHLYHRYLVERQAYLVS